jgi:MoaA/NifB/PqqE/SkfB family radical SAM enzyme
MKIPLTDRVDKVKIQKVLPLTVLNLARYIPRMFPLVTFKPSAIEIALTAKCCLKCIMCNYWRLDSSDELTTGEVKDILSQAKELGGQICNLYGGEPMLRKDIFEVIEYASGLGFDVRLLSNGYLINKTSARKLAESGTGRAYISIDALREVHDEIRGVRGAFDRAIAAIQELRRNNIGVQIDALLMRKTLEDRNIIQLITYMEEFGFPVYIQLLDFSPFYFKNNPNQDELWIPEGEQEEIEELVDELIKIKSRNPKLIINSIPALEYIRRYFRDPERADVPCYFVYLRGLWVDSQGKLYICQTLPPVGDLRKQRLKDIISSETYKERLQRAFMKECPGCGCGYSTNVDRLPSNMLKHFINKMSFRN